MAQMEHIDCFSKEPADTRLPEPIDGLRIGVAIAMGIDELKSAIGTFFSRDNLSTSARNHSNTKRVDDMGKRLTKP